MANNYLLLSYMRHEQASDESKSGGMKNMHVQLTYAHLKGSKNFISYENRVENVYLGIQMYLYLYLFESRKTQYLSMICFNLI